jgi:hypothetical protein
MKRLPVLFPDPCKCPTFLIPVLIYQKVWKQKAGVEISSFGLTSFYYIIMGHTTVPEGF